MNGFTVIDSTSYRNLPNVETGCDAPDWNQLVNQAETITLERIMHTTFGLEWFNQSFIHELIEFFSRSIKPSSVIDSAKVASPVQLADGQSIKISQPVGMRVFCHQGGLWITHNCDLKDVIIGSGETYLATRHQCMIITAIGPTTAQLSMVLNCAD